MRLKATNAALRDARDEAAILSNFSGSPFHAILQSSTAPTQLERWREMTKWVAQTGSVTIFNEEARHIRSDSTCLHETMAHIRGLAALEADWNDEAAPAIDPASIRQAGNFAQRLACVAAEHNLIRDCTPAVFPTIDGGVKVSWKANGHQVALVFRPGQCLIEIVEKSMGEAASHRLVSENEAGDIAISAMREAR